MSSARPTSVDELPPRRGRGPSANERDVLDRHGAAVDQHPKRHSPLVPARRRLGRVQVAVGVEPDDRSRPVARNETLDGTDVRAAATTRDERAAGERGREARGSAREASPPDGRDLRERERCPAAAAIASPPLPQARGTRTRPARSAAARVAFVLVRDRDGGQGPAAGHRARSGSPVRPDNGPTRSQLLLEDHGRSSLSACLRARRAALRPSGFRCPRPGRRCAHRARRTRGMRATEVRDRSRGPASQNGRRASARTPCPWSSTHNRRHRRALLRRRPRTRATDRHPPAPHASAGHVSKSSETAVPVVSVRLLGRFVEGALVALELDGTNRHPGPAGGSAAAPGDPPPSSKPAGDPVALRLEQSHGRSVVLQDAVVEQNAHVVPDRRRRARGPAAPSTGRTSGRCRDR